MQENYQLVTILRKKICLETNLKINFQLEANLETNSFSSQNLGS